MQESWCVNQNATCYGCNKPAVCQNVQVLTYRIVCTVAVTELTHKNHMYVRNAQVLIHRHSMFHGHNRSHHAEKCYMLWTKHLNWKEKHAMWHACKGSGGGKKTVLCLELLCQIQRVLHHNIFSIGNCLQWEKQAYSALMKHHVVVEIMNNWVLT